MITLSQITELLGWASILNVGFMIFSALLLMIMKSTFTSMHSKMYGIPENEVSIIYFKYLANYKSLTLMFMVAPYLALKIMGH